MQILWNLPFRPALSGGQPLFIFHQVEQNEDNGRISSMQGLAFGISVRVVVAAAALVSASLLTQPGSPIATPILAAAPYQRGKLRMRVSAAADENEAWRAKIAPGLALHLQKLAAEQRLSETLRILVLIHGELGPALQAKLEGAGLTIQGTAGSVISGAIRATELAALGQVDAVVLIDLPGRFRLTPPPLEPGPSK
jgi:hypothetical protein